MGKNSDNPFAALDAASFPSQHGKVKRRSLSQLRKEARKAREGGEDEELFLQAMANVSPLNGKDTEDTGFGKRRKNDSSLKGTGEQAERGRDSSFKNFRTDGISAQEKKDEDFFFKNVDGDGFERRERIAAQEKNDFAADARTQGNTPFAGKLKCKGKEKAKNTSSDHAGKDFSSRMEEKHRPEEETEEETDRKTFATLSAMAREGRRIGSQPDEEVGQTPPAPDQEAADFFRAIKGTEPLAGSGREIPQEIEPKSSIGDSEGNPLQDFLDGKVEFSIACTDEYAEGHVVGLDLMVVSQLQNRQYSPEAHIDLHGLNSMQAFQNLTVFFRNAYYKGLRTLLLVTGRGRNSPNGNPVLRTAVQEWLTQEPFKRIVLAFCTAKGEDGGAGAFYVLLRKRKKKAGKIHWDVIPSGDWF